MTQIFSIKGQGKKLGFTFVLLFVFTMPLMFATPLVGIVTALPSASSATQQTSSPGTTASYIIFGNETAYYAKNRTGAINYFGEHVNIVIQNVLDALTSKRTSKEKVVLQGDLGNIYEIKVPSYTIIEGSAKLTLPETQSVILNLGRSTDIEIRNIVFEATTTGRTVEAIGIDGGSQRIFIDSCHFNNFIYHSGTPSGVRSNTVDLKIQGNEFLSLSGLGNSYQIYLYQAKNIKITNNIFVSRFSGNEIYSYQVKSLEVTRNHFNQDACWLTGFVEGIDLEGANYVTIKENVFDSLSIDGVYIGGNTGAGNVCDVTINGNIFYRCGYLATAKRAGVSARSSATMSVNNVVINNNNFTACSIAVRIGEYMEDCIVKANIVGNLMMGGDYPVVFYGNAYNLKLTSNVFHDNINPPYIELGILYARFNEGYVTENKGTATISASTSVTFAHGLASAATHVNVKFKSGGYGRWTWSSDSTYITITVTKSGTYTFSWSADMYG